MRASTDAPDRGGQSSSNALWQKFILALLNVATTPIRALPRPAALRFGTALGGFAYRVAGKSRRRIFSNLELAYGDAMGEAKRTNLAKQVFAHFGRSVVEFIRGPLLTPAVLERLVRCEGWEHVEAAYAAGKGVLLITAHFGNWEVLGRYVASVRKLPLTIVARDPHNEDFSAYIKEIRENAGFAVTSKGTSASTLLRTLKRGEVIGILPDQNSGDLFAPFFGIPAGTVAGPASLALHTGAVLVPIYCIEEADGSYFVQCKPPVPAQSTGNKTADILRITTALNAILEEMIRQYPDQWLWMHHRWKSAFEKKNKQRAWGDSPIPARLNRGEMA